MKKEELDRLLEKYYNGESTEEEERTLSVFFDNDDVPAGYETEKAIFRYYLSAIPFPEPSVDFEQKILSGIDKSQKSSVRFLHYVLPPLGVAAGILILAGTWFYFSRQNDFQDTFTDPQIAYAETMKILLGVSSQLNDAERALTRVSVINKLPAQTLKNISRSGRIIEQSLENLSSLHEAIDESNYSEGEIEKNN